jgi:hypothetical protein
MISNLKVLILKFGGWRMAYEVHSVCPRRTSPRIMSRSWETGISRVERRIPQLYRLSRTKPNIIGGIQPIKSTDALRRTREEYRLRYRDRQKVD